MAKKIIKKIGGDRIGSGNKMNVALHGYGYSTHDVSKVRRTSMSFGTIVPMNQYLMPSNSRLKINLDALITSNALLYQLYGSAKFQIDVFSARMALYNPKMLLNLNDQGYEIKDIKFPLMNLITNKLKIEENGKPTEQVNPSALLRYLGIAGNGFRTVTESVPRDHNAMWLLMYYQTVKEYYANKQEKVGYIIHTDTDYQENVTGITVNGVTIQEGGEGIGVLLTEGTALPPGAVPDSLRWVMIDGSGTVANSTPVEKIMLYVKDDINDNRARKVKLTNIIRMSNKATNGGDWTTNSLEVLQTKWILGWEYATPEDVTIRLEEYDLKAIDRMQMSIMASVESTNPITISATTEYPYGASFKNSTKGRSINASQEGLAIGTYQSDVFNNWLDNDTINALNAKNKIKVNEEGEFSIDMLNITQKLYNYDMRIGVTDGTLDEWREVTYGQASKGKSLKPVYEGGLSKEILFDQIISTAATAESPLGDIASRGSFGGKHKGGYVQIDTDEEKLVMVLAKITPRIVYNQGNDWTTNLKTLEDLHKPALDKIGYQNLITDTMAYWETRIGSGFVTTKSAGKQPAWQWYRTSYDDALGNMASKESYKVFGREYEIDTDVNDGFKIKDLTTYIDPTKFNDVFAIKSLDYMNFDVQVGMDAKITLAMSEEVIPNL